MRRVKKPLKMVKETQTILVQVFSNSFQIFIIYLFQYDLPEASHKLQRRQRTGQQKDMSNQEWEDGTETSAIPAGIILHRGLRLQMDQDFWVSSGMACAPLGS